MNMKSNFYRSVLFALIVSLGIVPILTNSSMAEEREIPESLKHLFACKETITLDKIIHEVIVNISKIHSLRIIHQTNQKNIDFLKNYYSENKIENNVFSFDQNLNIFLSQSDLCITRAGASSLAELSILNIPFIAIPLPTAKDNHQLENANYYKNKDCCWIIEQKNFDKKNFEDLLLKKINDKDNFIKKKNNLENLNYQNTWNNVNQNLLKIINEN